MAQITPFSTISIPADGTHIIFVHGMFGSNRETWNNERNDFNWPTVMESNFIHTKVWGYDYRADLSKSILDIVSNFREHFLCNDELIDGRIVFIGHSFGGLVIKQLIVRLVRDTYGPSSSWNQFIKRIKGVVFLSTPHNGSNHKDYLKFIGNFFPAKKIPSYFIPDDFYLAELAQWYKVISNKYNIQNYSLVENLPTSNSELKMKVPARVDKLFKGGGLIVDKMSAGYNISNPTPVDKSHISISKPDNDKDDEVYTFVNGFLKNEMQIEQTTT